MTDFNDFLNIGCREAAEIMGESIEINGQTVNAVFDEQVSEWDMVEHGDLESPETTLVVALLDLNGLPKKKERCLLYTSPSPRDRTRSRMPSSA